MLFLARFSGIWEIFSSFIVLSFTSSEVDELEKSTCSVKLGIALFVCLFVCLFVSTIELNVNKHSAEENAGGLLSCQHSIYSHLTWLPITLSILL